MVSTLKSVHQKDKKTMALCFSATLTNMFISVDILDKFWPDTPLEFAGIGYYGMALHKTVPENCHTVTRLDRTEDDISTTLGRSANEKNYAKELNRPSLQQKDTEKAARCLGESQGFTAKLWNKGLATMRLIRSNEPPVAISQIVSTLMHCPLHLTKYDHFTTPNSKNNNNSKSLPAYFVLENNYASIDHFVTDETDLKVTGQSLFFVCCLTDYEAIFVHTLK